MEFLYPGSTTNVFWMLFVKFFMNNFSVFPMYFYWLLFIGKVRKKFLRSLVWSYDSLNWVLIYLFPIIYDNLLISKFAQFLVTTNSDPILWRWDNRHILFKDINTIKDLGDLPLQFLINLILLWEVESIILEWYSR
jgi:hypothetical protein